MRIARLLAISPLILSSLFAEKEFEGNFFGGKDISFVREDVKDLSEDWTEINRVHVLKNWPGTFYFGRNKAGYVRTGYDLPKKVDMSDSVKICMSKSASKLGDQIGESNVSTPISIPTTSDTSILVEERNHDQGTMKVMVVQGDVVLVIVRTGDNLKVTKIANSK